MMTTVSFTSLITALETLFHGESAELAELSQILECQSARHYAPKPETVEVWRELLKDLPLDPRSFNDIYAPHRFWTFVNGLSHWCKGFRATEPGYQKRYDTLYGFLGLMLLTFISLAESERRRSSQDVSGPSPANEGPAAPHHCDLLCEPLVQDPAVRRVIKCLYETTSAYSVEKNDYVKGPSKEWKLIEFETLSFHRHGTTSIILRADAGLRKACALKLILLPFLRFHTIGRETREYAKRYNPSGKTHGQGTSHGSNAAQVVEVLASSERWILMDFIEGLTLAEFLVRPHLVEEKLKHADASISDVLRESLESKITEKSHKMALTEVDRRFLADLRFLTVDQLVRSEDRIHSLSASSDSKPGRSTSEVSLDWMFTIGGALFDAMDDLRAVGQLAEVQSSSSSVLVTPVSIHGDLTPSNVIVNDSGGISVTLVDLGRSYFYTQSIAGTGGPESVFVAPEVREDNPSVKLADIYSIGQLLQYVGTRGSVPAEIVADGFYNRTPLVARFIEDLIQSDAGYRLRIFSSPKMADRIDYGELKKIFCEETSAVMAADLEGHSFASGGLWETLNDILHPFDGALKRQWKLWQKRKKQSTYKDKRIGGYARALFIWSAIASLAASLTALAVGMWFLRDVGWAWSDKMIEALQRIWGGSGDRFPGIDSLRVASYHVPDLHDNWPAWLVGISYVLASAKVYQNLFSGLMPMLGRHPGPAGWRAAGWRALAAAAYMRVQTVMCMFLVLSVVLFDARLWPIASAIGTSVIAFGNLALYSFSISSINTARDLGISTAGSQRTRLPGLVSFRMWVPASFFWTAIIWSIGSLIYIGVLHDVAVYAICLATANVFLFYVVKLSGTSGRDIRTAFARACTVAERVRIVEDAVRAWAAQQGIYIAARGRVSVDVLEKYQAAR